MMFYNLHLWVLQNRLSQLMLIDTSRASHLISLKRSEYKIDGVRSTVTLRQQTGWEMKKKSRWMSFWWTAGEEPVCVSCNRRKTSIWSKTAGNQETVQHPAPTETWIIRIHHHQSPNILQPPPQHFHPPNSTPSHLLHSNTSFFAITIHSMM